MSENVPAKAEDAPVPIPTGERGLQITSLDQLYRLAKYVVASKLAPQSIRTAEQAFIIMLAGSEAGLGYTASLQAIHVIKDRPTWGAKEAKGLVMSKNVCTHWEQGVTGEGDERYGWVKSQRKGLAGVKETRFSVAEAKSLGCYQRNPNYKTQLDTMLEARAIGRHCINWYADVMLNLRIREEVGDSDWPDAAPVEPPDKPDPLLEQEPVKEVEAEVEGEGADDLFESTS